MGVKDVDIFLDNFGIFNAGDSLTGTLSFDVTSHKVRIQEIALRVFGRENQQEETIIFEEKLNLSKELSAAGNTTTLNVGTHSIPVRLSLPQDLPPTSRSIDYGYTLSIRHSESIKPVTLPWTTFVIQGYLDLNSVPSASLPLRIGGQAEARKSGPLPCCSRVCGSFDVDLKVPKAGYTPGEKIQPVGTIENHSSLTLHELRLFLEQIMKLRQDDTEPDQQQNGGDQNEMIGTHRNTLTSSSSSHQNRRKRHQASHPPHHSSKSSRDASPERVRVVTQDFVPISLGPGHSRFIQGAALQIPFTPITTGSIEYNIRVQIDKHASYAVPVTIGSEPIRDLDDL